VKKRFSVEQIVAVLKQAEVGVPVELIRQVGITEQTLGKLTHSSDQSRGPVATIRATCSEGGKIQSGLVPHLSSHVHTLLTTRK
jgi:hypothetical protein